MCIRDSSNRVDKLMDDVLLRPAKTLPKKAVPPSRQSANRKGQQASQKEEQKRLTRDEAIEAMEGLFSKYNWEYRRPMPNSKTAIEKWKFRKCIKGSDFNEKWAVWHWENDYMVKMTDLQQTAVWENEDIDWKYWTKCSMVLPVFSDEPSPASKAYYTREGLPAVGGTYYVRTVLATNFPAFCHLFGNEFTAYELESAWLNMPLVKRSKPNRGSTSSSAKKRKWED